MSRVPGCTRLPGSWVLLGCEGRTKGAGRLRDVHIANVSAVCREGSAFTPLLPQHRDLSSAFSSRGSLTQPFATGTIRLQEDGVLCNQCRRYVRSRLFGARYKVGLEVERPKSGWCRGKDRWGPPSGALHMSKLSPRTIDSRRKDGDDGESPRTRRRHGSCG